METLGFKIEGQFVTDMARQWFWKEGKAYSICEELLLSCLCTDQIELEEKKYIAQSIIEGKKKLVGINIFTLEDDGEDVHELSEMLNIQKKKLDISEIEKHMMLQPFNYVDIYSTTMSVRSYAESRYNTQNGHDYEEIYKWFTRYSDINERDTMCGLWILENSNRAKLVYDIFGKPVYEPMSDEFMKKITEYIDANPSYFSSTDFKDRQERYKASVRIKEERRKQIDNMFENIEVKKDEEDLSIYRDDVDDISDKEFAIRLKKHSSERGYNVFPDDYEKFEGLIDPQGNFYSCDFGGHSLKAYNIIRTYPERFGYKSRNHDTIWLMDTALDILIEHGWIATRYLYDRNYITKGIKNPTKAQVNAVYDTMIKHDITHVDGLEDLL